MRIPLSTLPRALGTSVAPVLAALAVGCGSEDDKVRAPRGNATDAAFVADMTPHHRGAIEMAELARARAEHFEVRDLAVAIVETQRAEIALMRRIRDELPRVTATEASHMGLSRRRMGMHGDRSALRSANPFDLAFIDMMVPHHRGAVVMARRVEEQGRHPRVRRLARAIIAAQRREIAQMRAWRREWFGTSRAPVDGGAHDHGVPVLP